MIVLIFFVKPSYFISSLDILYEIKYYWKNEYRLSKKEQFTIDLPKIKLTWHTGMHVLLCVISWYLMLIWMYHTDLDHT